MLVIESKEGEQLAGLAAQLKSVQHSDVVFYFYVTYRYYINSSNYDSLHYEHTVNNPIHTTIKATQHLW